MAFKIGSTTVISNSSQVHWNRITGIPANVNSAVGTVAVSNCGAGSALHVTRSGTGVTLKLANTNCNCNCNCNCRD